MCLSYTPNLLPFCHSDARLSRATSNQNEHLEPLFSTSSPRIRLDVRPPFEYFFPMHQPVRAAQPPPKTTVEKPIVSLPVAAEARTAVKEALNHVMAIPKLGDFVRAFAAEQTIFPNFRVDQLTYYTLQSLLKEDSCCIDIGAHKGEITKMFLQLAPKGNHIAIEPLVECVEHLATTFAANPNVTVLPFAVAESSGKRDFIAVRRSPGFSGFADRKFSGGDPELERRTVETVRLDDVIDPGARVNLIKLDIEGAELQALKGAERILRTSHPTLLIEFQRSSVPYFEHTPYDMFTFLSDHGYSIWSLDSWLDERPPLTLAKLWDLYEEDPNLYLLCSTKAQSGRGQ